MKKHYDLQLARTDIAGVSVRFWSSEKCELSVIRGKFFYEPKKSDEYSVSLTAIFLENDWRDCFFTFPKEKHSYTSLNFIVKELKSPIKRGIHKEWALLLYKKQRHTPHCITNDIPPRK